LYFRGTESGDLAAFLRTGRGTKEGPALRLTHQDPWIAASHRARGEMFFNRNNEFFVFQLRPVGAEGSERLIGFVIADIAYRPQKHMPGLGFPDLAMTAFALNLIAGLWHARENAKSYFHLLGALPSLRHSGGRIVQAVDEFAEATGQSDPTDDDVRGKKEQLRSLAVDLARAKEIVDEVRGHARDERILDLRELLLDFGRRAEARHEGLLRWELVEPFPMSPVRMHSDDLESVLLCLVDNAVIHGRSDNHPTVTCRVSVAKKAVPLGAREGWRLLLQIENDGTSIPEEIVPFLFSDGVSTNLEGHGTGLSSARQIAKAYGGDVILVCANPVRFGVVLEPAPQKEEANQMCRVLIVDDNAVMRNYLSGIVREWDGRLEVVAAGSEPEARDLLAGLDSLGIAVVDLFLTDDWAPNHPDKGEGLRVLEAVRKRFPNCFKILITAKRESVDPRPDLVDYFVSFHDSNRDYRSQLEDAIQKGTLAAV